VKMTRSVLILRRSRDADGRRAQDKAHPGNKSRCGFVESDSAVRKEVSIWN
jgi:hypothetical protein